NDALLIPMSCAEKIKISDKSGVFRRSFLLMELSFGLNHLVVRDSEFSLVAFKNCCTRVDAPVVSTFVAKIAAENRKTNYPLEKK
ncbi:MAG TPA: hypothetical protein VJW55_18740, partial [Candidatus Angelobacter sp.]|nr:hypothetical protein [Candidatus Angelobacter sp.]